MKLRNLLIAAAGLTLAVGAAGAASAETNWQYHHGHRVEVNHRLTRLNDAVARERYNGEISGWQAHRLHAHLHAIRAQEHWYASHDNGHLTRWEQHRLNREENGVRHHI